jgi:site-specific DNA-methyltransferase (adenine-specific)
MEIFEKDEHKIILGDCIKGMSHYVEDNSVDLIFADPPYNIGKNFNGRKDKLQEDEYLNWCYTWLDLCIQKLKSNGSFYVMTSTQMMDAIPKVV